MQLQCVQLLYLSSGSGAPNSLTWCQPNQSTVQIFREAVLLKRVHRSQEDMWWTESCLRLRNISRDTLDELKQDYEIWRRHDIDRGHLTEDQKEHFENNAVWLCARCEDVGTRNGRKLAHLALDPESRVLTVTPRDQMLCDNRRWCVAAQGLVQAAKIRTSDLQRVRLTSCLP